MYACGVPLESPSKCESSKASLTDAVQLPDDKAHKSLCVVAVSQLCASGQVSGWQGSLAGRFYVSGSE